MPATLTPTSVAVPLPAVVGQGGSDRAPQTAVPLSLKVTVLPLTPVAGEPDVRVALKFAVPPNVPLAGLTAREVATAVGAAIVSVPVPIALPVWPHAVA